MHQQEMTVDTGSEAKNIVLPVKSTGYGSAVNGGELLMLALATCYCNDIYREAAKQNITVTGIEVECSSEFGGEGEPGDDFQYRVKINADAPAEVINALIRSTDRVAEVHNTLRRGVAVHLVK